MNDETRERLRVLQAAATPGPWDATAWDLHPHQHRVTWAVIAQDSETLIADMRPKDFSDQSERMQNDAALIAAARNALPALLDALDAAEAERDAALARVAELEATVARVEALANEHAKLAGRYQLLINGAAATRTERGLIEGFAMQLSDALSLTQPETEAGQ